MEQRSGQSAPMSRDEVRTLARYANLDLAPQYFEELVQAYALVEGMLATVRRELPLAAEPAHVFVAKTFEPAGE